MRLSGTGGETRATSGVLGGSNRTDSGTVRWEDCKAAVVSHTEEDLLVVDNLDSDAISRAVEEFDRMMAEQ